MAVPMKGEAIVRVDAGEFTLSYSLAAMARIQGERPGKSVNEVLRGLEKDSADQVDDMILVIWAGLRKHHDLSLDEVGEILMIPEMQIWSDAIGLAMRSGAPEVKDKTRPQKAATAR